MIGSNPRLKKRKRATISFSLISTLVTQPSYAAQGKSLTPPRHHFHDQVSYPAGHELLSRQLIGLERRLMNPSLPDFSWSGEWPESRSICYSLNTSADKDLLPEDKSPPDAGFSRCNIPFPPFNIRSSPN